MAGIKALHYDDRMSLLLSLTSLDLGIVESQERCQYLGRRSFNSYSFPLEMIFKSVSSSVSINPLHLSPIFFIIDLDHRWRGNTRTRIQHHSNWWLLGNDAAVGSHHCRFSLLSCLLQTPIRTYSAAFLDWNTKKNVNPFMS